MQDEDVVPGEGAQRVQDPPHVSISTDLVRHVASVLPKGRSASGNAGIAGSGKLTAGALTLHPWDFAAPSRGTVCTTPGRTLPAAANGRARGHDRHSSTCLILSMAARQDDARDGGIATRSRGYEQKSRERVNVPKPGQDRPMFTNWVSSKVFQASALLTRRLPSQTSGGPASAGERMMMSRRHEPGGTGAQQRVRVVLRASVSSSSYGGTDVTEASGKERARTPDHGNWLACRG
jgi:hypothetical protein